MQLIDYQQKTKDFMLVAKRGYIALDMGMGKTLTSLSCAIDFGKQNVLLVAELNEIANSENFRKEIEAHFDHIKYYNLRETDIKEIGSERCVCGINPAGLTKIDPKTIKKQFDCVIIDEATLAKNTSTQRFKLIRKISSEAEYVFLLSGTPMLNGCAELYAPLLLLGHSMIGEGSAQIKQAFEKVFAGGNYKQIRSKKGHTEEYLRKYWWKFYSWVAKDAKHVRVLRYLLRDKFFIMSKSESKLFKKKTRRLQYVDMTIPWVSEYTTAWDNYLEEAKKRSVKMDNIVDLKKLIENGQCYQVNSKWKAKQVIADIASGMYGNKRIVVFTMYIETEAVLCNELERLGIKYSTFENIKEWKESDEQVIVGRIIANGKGGNLPEACVCIMVDMHYVPSNNLQAENRIDRPQQKNDMDIVYYVTRGEDIVDQHVTNINRDKMTKINEFMRPLKDEEIPAILKEIEVLRERYPAETSLLNI